jgi:hypothetical protein
MKIRLDNIILDEMARRNPEQNPKINLKDGLERYKDDPDIYISFTNIDKIGINPSSNYNTPNGIYTYPLTEIWDNILKNNVPFEGDEVAHHVWVIKKSSKDDGRFIDDLFSKYTSNTFDHDIGLLRKLYGKMDITDVRLHPADLVEFYDDLEHDKSLDGLIEYAMETSKFPYIASKFFNITRLLAQIIYYSKNRRPIESTAMAWNSILRDLGYSGFADKSGKGIIHESEPTQAVFLHKKAFEVVDKLENRKGVLKNATNVIKKLIDLDRPIPPEGKYALKTDYHLGYSIITWLFNTYSLEYIIKFLKKYNVKTTWGNTPTKKKSTLDAIIGVIGSGTNITTEQGIDNLAEILKKSNSEDLLSPSIIPPLIKYYDDLSEYPPDIVYDYAISTTSTEQYVYDTVEEIIDYMKNNLNTLIDDKFINKHFPDKSWYIELAESYLADDEEIPDKLLLYLNTYHFIHVIVNDELLDAMAELYIKTKNMKLVRSPQMLVRLVKYYNKHDKKELKRIINYGIEYAMLKDSIALIQVEHILYDLFAETKDSKYLLNEHMFDAMISEYRDDKKIVYQLLLDAIDKRVPIKDHKLLAKAYLDTFNIEYIASKEAANDVIFNYDVENKMPKKVYDDMMNKLSVLVLPVKYRNFLMDMAEQGLIEGIDAVEEDDGNTFTNYLKNNKVGDE